MTKFLSNVALISRVDGAMSLLAQGYRQSIRQRTRKVMQEFPDLRMLVVGGYMQSFYRLDADGLHERVIEGDLPMTALDVIDLCKHYGTNFPAHPFEVTSRVPAPVAENTDAALMAGIPTVGEDAPEGSVLLVPNDSPVGYEIRPAAGDSEVGA